MTAVTGYDVMYNPTGTSTTIPAGYGPLSGTYANAMAYGPDGSLTSQADPAAGGLPAETLLRGYDSLGNESGLHSDTGSYLLSTTYDHLNRAGQTIQGEGATTAYRTSYYDDATNRTSRTLTQRSAPTDAVVADRNYTYSNAGDITANTDNTASVGVDTQCFSYDYARQLSAAWTPNSTSCATAPTSSTIAGPAPYWASYTYDTIGNRTSLNRHATTTGGTDQVDTSTYPAPGQAQPHGVSAAGRGRHTAGRFSASHPTPARGEEWCQNSVNADSQRGSALTLTLWQNEIRGSAPATLRCRSTSRTRAGGGGSGSGPPR